ncbi:MAG: RCC1 repeat-containing protein [Nitrospirota bacterium]|nr:RCC1 repeat-containing protein [Nitrospirota bacterium]
MLKKMCFKTFMGVLIVLFAGLWITGDVADASSGGMKQREHHRHHSPGASYNVGGIVNELGDGETVVLLNNGRDKLEITANGVFAFSTPVSDLATYDVTVETQPSNQYCRINNGSGTINGEDITDITIRCSIFSVAIAAGNNHAVVLKNDGTVWTWGNNNLMPFQVIGLTDVIAIAAGDGHTVALKSDGTVWTWGDNKYGQLGNGTRTRSYTPVQVCDTGETAPCTNFLTDVIDITAGGDNIVGMAHTVALKSDGTVWAWGSNQYGQLGNGTTTRSTTPVQVSGLTTVVAIAAGKNYTIALKADGTVRAWGRNWPGTLGDGTTDESTTPVEVSGLTDINAIAAGNDHTLALKIDGTVWAWGGNIHGQLGDGTSTYKITPIQVSGLTDVDAIAAGWGHSIALKSDGTTWTWGDNKYGQLGRTATYYWDYYTPAPVDSLMDVIGIAAGGSLAIENTAFSQGYSLSLKSDGTVWAWGDNQYGQLGDGTRTNSLTPVQVLGETAPYIVDNYSLGGTVNGLVDGETIVLQNNGVNDLTITADGVFSFSTPVSDLAAYNVAISTQPDSRFCRVDNDSGTINGEDVTDISVTCFDFFADVTAVASGSRFTIALKADGTVWAWGAGGALGDGTETSSATPVQVCDAGETAPCSSFLTDVAAIGAGDSNAVALKTDGTVWAWGNNSDGQLGDGTTTSSRVPIQVDITAIASGAAHTIILKTDGTVWAWGWNYYGQLGDGTTIDRTTPVQVSGLTDVIAIAAGVYHNVALKSDGTVWAWGYNGLGQLGDGTTIDRLTPVQVSDLSNVTVIAAKPYSALALKSEGTVWTWGAIGRLDITTTETCNNKPCSTTPVQANDLTDVTDIAAGRGFSDNTIVLKSDGTVWAWGDNGSGTLGDGTTTDSSTPVQVNELTDVIDITAGNGHAIALKTDGTVWAWGNNSWSQLGLAVTTSCPDIDMGVFYYPCSTTPVPVLVTP